MRTRTKSDVLTLIAGSICWALAAVVWADEAGKSKFSTCSGCHAIAGYANIYPTYHVPKLSGQHPEYIVSALQAYRADERNHETMHANASNLSDDDMKAIAAYVNSAGKAPKAPPVTGDAAAGKAKLDELKAKNTAMACSTCHGEDGNSTTGLYPILAGQYEDYLLKALRDYKSGARRGAAAGLMATVFTTFELSDQDLADLAAYYASQKPALATVDF